MAKFLVRSLGSENSSQCLDEYDDYYTTRDTAFARAVGRFNGCRQSRARASANEPWYEVTRAFGTAVRMALSFLASLTLTDSMQPDCCIFGHFPLVQILQKAFGPKLARIQFKAGPRTSSIHGTMLVVNRKMASQKSRLRMRRVNALTAGVPCIKSMEAMMRTGFC